MSKPNHKPLPEELQDALSQKSTEEQERIKQVWQLLGHLESDDLETISEHIPDTEEALADLEASIETNVNSQIRTFAKDRPAKRLDAYQNSRAMQWTTMVASLSVVLFALMIWYWRVPVVVKAPLGEQVSVVLPDNSIITLNSGSRLEYARRFESWPLISTAKRRVFLQGEAFFEVEKKVKPFIIETFNTQVRVLGTTFNIWSREHDVNPETRVALASGEVLVVQHEHRDIDMLDEDQATLLNEPGQMVRVVTNVEGVTENLTKTIPADYVSAWRTNGLVAAELPIGSLVAEIERQYAISIQLDSEIDVMHKMTFYLQEKPSAEALIEDICLSIGCQFRPTNNGFHIFPAERN